MTERIEKMAVELANKVIKLKATLQQLCRKLDEKHTGFLNITTFDVILQSKKIQLPKAIQEKIRRRYRHPKRKSEINYRGIIKDLKYQPTSESGSNWQLEDNKKKYIFVNKSTILRTDSEVPTYTSGSKHSIKDGLSVLSRSTICGRSSQLNMQESHKGSSAQSVISSLLRGEEDVVSYKQLRRNVERIISREGTGRNQGIGANINPNTYSVGNYSRMAKRGSATDGRSSRLIIRENEETERCKTPNLKERIVRELTPTPHSSKYNIITHQEEEQRHTPNSLSGRSILLSEESSTPGGSIMHRKRPQNQILQDLDRLGIEIKSSSKSSTPQNNQYKMNNFYHYSGLNVPGVNSNKSRTIDHEMTENTNTSNSNLKEILKIFYDYRIEPRQLNVLRMAFLRADKNNTGLIPEQEFHQLLRGVLPDIKQHITLITDEVTSSTHPKEASYDKLCDIINAFIYEPFQIKYEKQTAQSIDTPLRSTWEQKIYTDEEERNLDVVMDFIWCKLHEKFKKISQAFRSMDLTSRGKLSVSEFRFGLEKLNIRLNADLTQKVFNLLDQDEDGLLSYSEFTLLCIGSKDRILIESNERQNNIQSTIGSRTIKQQQNAEKRLKNMYKEGEFLGLKTGDTVMEYLLEPEIYNKPKPPGNIHIRKKIVPFLSTKSSMGRAEFIRRMSVEAIRKKEQLPIWKMPKFKRVKSRMRETGGWVDYGIKGGRSRNNGEVRAYGTMPRDNVNVPIIRASLHQKFGIPD